MNVMEIDYNNLAEKKICYIYERIFFSDECEEICDLQIDKDILKIDYNPVSDPFRPRENYEQFVIENQNHLEEKLIKYIFDCNTRNYGYEIWGFETDPKLLTFHEGSEYGFHTRLNFYSDEPCDRKLTGYVFLSSPGNYEGGKVETDPLSETTIPNHYNHIGNLLIYPSFVPIRISPVQRGALQVLTFDIVGPKLK